MGLHAHADTKSEEHSLDSPQLQTGNGEWTYRVVSDWGQLPAGKTFGGTHGGIATDKAGNLYVSTQSTTGVLVYDRVGVIDGEGGEVNVRVYVGVFDGVPGVRENVGVFVTRGAVTCRMLIPVRHCASGLQIVTLLNPSEALNVLMSSVTEVDVRKVALFTVTPPLTVAEM